MSTARPNCPAAWPARPPGFAARVARNGRTPRPRRPLAPVRPRCNHPCHSPGRRRVAGGRRSPMRASRQPAPPATHSRAPHTREPRSGSVPLEQGGRQVSEQVAFVVNGTAHTVEVEPRRLLVEVLREDLDLTGTHVGCDTSQCGACTVLLDGRAIKSCTMLAVQADGSQCPDDRRPGPAGRPAPAPAGLLGEARPPVRLLHAGHDHGRGRPPRGATPTRPTPRSATRSRATSAAARATRTSSPRSARPPGSWPRPAAGPAC